MLLGGVLAYHQRVGLTAVLAAALRVVIPGMAGMARMLYGTFAGYNVAGGAVWATALVLIGYLAGVSWQRAARLASRIVSLLARAAQRQSGRLHELGDRLVATPPAAWVRRRFPTRLAWLRRRLDPAAPDGLSVTVALVLAGLCAWTFGGLTQDVLTGETTQVDRRVHAFVVAHRTGWLTLILRNVTWLGSSLVLVPLLAVVAAALLRKWRLREALYLWAAFLGAVVLYPLAKQLVHRPRPPATDLIGSASGLAFPSGHSTQVIAAWGALAMVLFAGRSRRGRVLLVGVTTAVVVLVGASRVYLGAHWLTDVLGGYVLGSAWLALVAALYLRSRTGLSASDAGPPAGRRPVAERTD